MAKFISLICVFSLLNTSVAARDPAIEQLVNETREFLLKNTSELTKKEKMVYVVSCSNKVQHLMETFFKRHSEGKIEPYYAAVVLDTMYGLLADNAAGAGQSDAALEIMEHARHFYKNTSYEPNRIMTMGGFVELHDPQRAIEIFLEVQRRPDYLQGRPQKSEHDAYVALALADNYERIGDKEKAADAFVDYLSYVERAPDMLDPGIIHVLDRYKRVRSPKDNRFNASRIQELAARANDYERVREEDRNNLERERSRQIEQEQNDMIFAQNFVNFYNSLQDEQ